MTTELLSEIYLMAQYEGVYITTACFVSRSYMKLIYDITMDLKKISLQITIGTIVPEIFAFKRWPFVYRTLIPNQHFSI